MITVLRATSFKKYISLMLMMLMVPSMYGQTKDPAVQALWQAMNQFDYEAIKNIVQKHGKGILKELHMGKTPFLHMASIGSARGTDMAKHDDIMKFMLAQGVDISQTALLDRTALIWALESKKTELPSWLIHEGIDIHKEDSGGASAIWHAANNKNLVIVDQLLEHGANINDTDEWLGWTPLMLAINQGDLDLFIHLVDEGALTSIKDEKGRDALALVRQKISEAENLIAQHGRGFRRFVRPTMQRHEQMLNILTGGVSAEEFDKMQAEIEEKIKEKEALIDWDSFDW